MSEGQFVERLEASNHRRPRFAGAIILTSFIFFCILTVAIPWVIQTWIATATTPLEAVMQPLNGTVLVNNRGVGVEEGEFRVREGDVIRTDQTSSAVLIFFDGSEATIYQGAEVEVAGMRVPSFDLSPQPNSVILRQKGGRIRIVASPPSSRLTSWQVITPHLTATLQPGSYSVQVSNEESEVSVRSGQAEVTSGGGMTTIPTGKRCIFSLQGCSGLLDAARNLMINGDFSQGLTGWEIRPPAVPDLPQGTVDRGTSGGRQTISIHREGESGVHTEAGVIQGINQNVSDFVSLEIRLDVRVDFHDLSGGGSQSSEYPVIVRIDYVDQFGSPAHWYHGFYTQNETSNPTFNGEMIPQGVWFPYEETNLLELMDPKPARILSLQVYASGWNYDSLVTEIGLLVE